MIAFHTGDDFRYTTIVKATYANKKNKGIAIKEAGMPFFLLLPIRVHMIVLSIMDYAYIYYYIYNNTYIYIYIYMVAS
jgi:hypothetical protein